MPIREAEDTPVNKGGDEIKSSPRLLEDVIDREAANRSTSADPSRGITAERSALVPEWPPEETKFLSDKYLSKAPDRVENNSKDSQLTIKNTVSEVPVSIDVLNRVLTANMALQDAVLQANTEGSKLNKAAIDKILDQAIGNSGVDRSLVHKLLLETVNPEVKQAYLKALSEPSSSNVLGTQKSNNAASFAQEMASELDLIEQALKLKPATSDPKAIEGMYSKIYDAVKGQGPNTYNLMMEVWAQKRHDFAAELDKARTTGSENHPDQRNQVREVPFSAPHLPVENATDAGSVSPIDIRDTIITRARQVDLLEQYLGLKPKNPADKAAVEVLGRQIERSVANATHPEERKLDILDGQRFFLEEAKKNSAKIAAHAGSKVVIPALILGGVTTNFIVSKAEAQEYKLPSFEMEPK